MTRVRISVGSSDLQYVLILVLLGMLSCGLAARQVEAFMPRSAAVEIQ